MYAPVGEGPSNQRPSLVNPWWLHPPGTTSCYCCRYCVVPPPPVALSMSDVHAVSESFRGYLFVLIANRDRCVWGVGDYEGATLNSKHSDDATRRKTVKLARENDYMV